MFKVVANPTFTHAVPVMTPVDGGHREESVSATFRVLTTDEIAKYDLNTPTGTAEFLRASVSKLDEVTDEKDQPLPYSDELRDRLLKLPYFRVALVRGYFEAVGKAKAGN